MMAEEAATKIQNARRAQLARRERREREEMRSEEAAIKIQNARRAQLARREREEMERGEAVQHLFGEDNMKALARERDTKEMKNMLNERRETAKNLNGLGKTLDEKNKRYINDRFGIESLELDAQRRGAEEARSVAEENRKKINISDEDKLDIEVNNIVNRYQKKQERAARRDRERLNEMVAASLAKNREAKRDALELRAKDAHLQAHLKRNENALRKELAQQQEAQQNSGTSELRNINEAANKIQNAASARLARRKAAELKDQEKIQKHRKNAAARKLTEALRANKERKEAQRQAQNNSDALLAEQEQLLEKLAADQINANNLLAQQEQAREYLGMNAQEPSNTTATRETVVANEERHVAAMSRQQEEFRQRAVGDSEAVETDHWSLPRVMDWQFRGFDFESPDHQRQAKFFAYQLKDLSIRKVECILWLVALSYWDLLQAGGDTGSAEIYEAVCNVKDVFPKTGPEAKVSPAIMNVYNAFENTSPADFEKDLTPLGSRELNAVLYFVAKQYMQLLKDEKKAADRKFIELAKAAVEHFYGAWEAEDAEVFEESEAREAAVVNGNRQEPAVSATAGVQGIVETEAPETAIWNPPYRVYYAYCTDLKRGLRPSRKSMELFQNKENRAQLYRDQLRNLSIRRLEATIYYAAGAYECREIEQRSELNKSVEDIRKVYQKTEEGKQNAREQNVVNAIKNMVDEPNDNPVSMQPFYKGFTGLTTYEQENAFIDMAIVYREMLRNGKRPANMAFVNFANEVCKLSSADGFINGKDNTHPELKFEEFGNEAKQPQGSDTANANNNPAVISGDESEAPDNSFWTAPSGISAAFSYQSHNDEANKFQKKVRRLTIRQQEALLKVASSVYVKMLTEMHATPIERGLQKSAQAVGDRFNMMPLGDRLLNVLRATKHSTGFESELLETYRHDFNNKAFRLTEKLLLALSIVYMESVNSGKVSADKVFVDLAEVVFKTFGYSAEGEYEGNVSESPAALEDNSKLEEIRTGTWQLPICLPTDMGDGDEYYDEGAWRENVNGLNIRQLEVLLVEFAKVYKEKGFRGRMASRMNAVSEAFEHLDAPGNNQTRVAEFRSAMEKARGIAAFEEDQGSVTEDGMNMALEIVQSEYIQKLNTANPVTPKFRKAVKGR